MVLHLYNDLTREKELFKPLTPGRVLYYSCGPTVYDYFHIGNARPFIVFDVLRRYLSHIGYQVTYVQNFTDIDDKMIRRAEEMGITVDALAEKFIQAYFEDADALGIRRADFYPRATHEIPFIIEFVEKLLKKGHAYIVGRDVYFSIESFKDYGKLSGQSLEELRSGARVEVDETKHHPLDFALWKGQKPGEPAWESPWGPGRPGWHIECSAMSTRYLGESIDIHSGGCDLIFPHHENEIAQSEAASGKQFATFWIHNGYLMIDKEKMSKSLGNFLTAREARKQFPPLAIRFFMLSAHYRSPLNFSMEGLEQAKNASERLANGLLELTFALEKRDSAPTSDETLRKEFEQARDGFYQSMDDDFNTAGAIGYIFELVRAVNSSLSKNEPIDRELLLEVKSFLDTVEDILGIFGVYSADQEKGSDDIQALIDERDAARKSKNFKRSDEIRDQLLEQGIILEDTAQGTRWKTK